MKLWMVRGGQHGEQEAVSLENGLACIGYYDIPDLSVARTKEATFDLVRATFPDWSDPRVGNVGGQLFAFAHRMEKGDLVAMPLKSQPQIALGVVDGPYAYRNDLGEIHHTRKVKWVRLDVPRSAFNQDLLASLGAFMTVCQIRRNNAVERVAAILEGKPDPGAPIVEDAEEIADAGTPVDSDLIDVEQVARDQVRAHIEANFKTHDLSRLVEAVLQAEGYVTHLSPPGPDGGVDILARHGSLGFSGPKLCVQVKSSISPADVTIFRALQGTMTTFKADEGLLECWGGFNRVVQQEARLSFFSVRLWDADDLIAAIERNYDRLPTEIQSELPLKRIWALVPEEA